MRSKMHRTLRRTAVGAGALLLALGTVGCTGGDEEPDGQQTSATSRAAEDGSTASATPESSDGGGEKSASPFSEEELGAASQRFVDVLQVIDDQDWEAACGFVLDPTTGKAPEGERLQECADGVEPAMAGHADQLQPGMFDGVDPSMVQASDNGDDTVSLSVIGEDLDIPMVQGEDGQWYLSIPF